MRDERTGWSVRSDMRSLRWVPAFAFLACGGRSQLVVGGAARDANVTDANVADAPAIRALAITAGRTHACARMSDGQSRCWGGNAAGQLGDGSTSDRWRPVQVLLPDGASLIAAGGSHTCGQAPGGSVF